MANTSGSSFLSSAFGKVTSGSTNPSAGKKKLREIDSPTYQKS